MGKKKDAKRKAARDNHPVTGFGTTINTPADQWVVHRPGMTDADYPGDLGAKYAERQFAERALNADDQKLVKLMSEPTVLDPEQEYELSVVVVAHGYGTSQNRKQLAQRICNELRVNLHDDTLQVFMDGAPVEPLTYKIVG